MSKNNHSDKNKESLSNVGKKWTDEEEAMLLDELNNNIDIQVIAQSHNRTTNGINARCKLIAYEMYTNNVSTEEICKKMKLNESELMDTIKQMENKPKRGRKKLNEKIQSSIYDGLENEDTSLKNENDIKEIKKDIEEIKNNIKELVSMMKALYEFEHS